MKASLHCHWRPIRGSWRLAAVNAGRKCCDDSSTCICFGSLRSSATQFLTEIYTFLWRKHVKKLIYHWNLNGAWDLISIKWVQSQKSNTTFSKISKKRVFFKWKVAIHRSFFGQNVSRTHTAAVGEVSFHNYVTWLQESAKSTRKSNTI